MNFEKCPHCDSRQIRCDKYTFTGRDLRDWSCSECGWTETIDRGIALWKALSEIDEDSRSDPEGNPDQKNSSS